MNHDAHKPDLSTLIDPELEARIVAWVSGEASPFETAELTRLTDAQPELAIFQRRIAAVSGLVGEAIRPDKEPLRLAPERRTKLLHTLGAAEFRPNSASATTTVVLPMAAMKKKQRRYRYWHYGLAASFAIGLFTVFAVNNHELLGLRFLRPPGYADSMSGGDEADPDSVFQKTLDLVRFHSAKKLAPRKELLAAFERDKKEREAAYQAAVNSAARRQSERSAAPEDFAMADSSNRLQEAKEEAAAYKLKTASDAKQRLVRESKKAQARPLAFAPSPGGTPSAPATVAIPLPPPVAKGGSRGIVAQPAEEQIVLSPFTVEAKGDAGYAASNTLSGKRIRTELKDVSSALSVRTDQFLKDTGATSSKELLAYTSNTEVGGLRGNFTPPQTYEPSIRAGFEGRSVDHFNSLTIDPTSAANVGDDKVDRSIDGPKVTVEENAEAITADASLPRNPAQQPTPILSEINASKEPVSTFSLHVSDVSFRLAQAALAKGEALDRASIRPEEFYNAFSYGDPTPALTEKVSCRVEQAAHPFVQQRNLVRIAVKVAASGRDAAQPLHLTVLLDTSGSMEREDRAATIQSAMKALTSLLGSNDRLTLIGFSRQPRLLAEALSGDQAAQVLDLIKNTPAEGGTNLEEALKLGSELARRQFNATAQNRIVLLTDGAANLGNANPAQLAASIEALRQQGIAFDACGVGLEGLDDGMLENLTRKGDGRYYVLNSPEAADAGFAKQLAGAFRPAAENVKLQVRFNPARVGNYRLIGFEQHRLREEDFRNDKVDAAELAAEEAAVAVYQVEALPQGEGELGEVYVRFRDASSGNMVERNWTLNYDSQTPAFDRATPSIQLAGTAALLAEKLQGGEAAAAINLGDLAPVVTKLRSHYANEPRVQELVTMFEQARKMAGE